MSFSATKREAAVEAPYMVLYDGDCQMCQRAASLLKQLDTENKTVGTPLTDEVLQKLGHELSMHDCLQEMHIISATGKVERGYFAILRLADQCPRTRWLARIIRFLTPVPLGKFVYRMIANNRYRLIKCDSGSCNLEHRK